jgi:hypothetical protein
MIKKVLLLMFVSAATLFVSPLPAHAFNAYSGVDCGGKQNQAAVCADRNNGDPIGGQHGVLLKITDIVAYIAGAVAIIMILVGSIRFITSGSDISTNTRTDSDVEKAKHTIAGALIGLAIIVLAKVLISYVVGKL